MACAGISKVVIAAAMALVNTSRVAGVAVLLLFIFRLSLSDGKINRGISLSTYVNGDEGVRAAVLGRQSAERKLIHYRQKFRKGITNEQACLY